MANTGGVNVVPHMVNMLHKFFRAFLALAILIAFVSSDDALAQMTASSRLPIPPAATVLTLTGLNFNLTNYMPDVFQGKFSRPPYRIVEVRYPASIGPQTISKGVRALDNAMRDTPGPLIVLAHSQGAQVASHWMREHANDPTAPAPNRVMFILLGNPLRSFGGSAIGHREFGGTIGEPTPITTPWTIVDVARRYDGWADSPSDASNRLAAKNANLGKRTYHTHYNEVDLDDPTHTVWSRGNTTYVLTHETLPMWRNGPKPTEREQRETIAYVESAYNRPPNDLSITPMLNQSAGAGAAWHSKRRRWGVSLQPKACSR